MSFLIHRGLLKVYICAPEPVPKTQPSIASVEPEIRIRKKKKNRKKGKKEKDCL